MTTETVDLPQICHHGEKQNGECYCAVSQHFQENPQIHTWSNSHQQICKSLQNTNPKILAKYLHGIITQSFTDFFYLHSDCSIELYTVCYLNCLCNILGWFVTRWEWFLIWKYDIPASIPHRRVVHLPRLQIHHPGGNKSVRKEELIRHFLHLA